MTNHDPSAWLPDQQPTTDRNGAMARWLAVSIWFFGILSLVSALVTGAVWWHFVALAIYSAILPVGVGLSTALRHQQRDLDRLWAQRVRDLAARDDLTGLFNRRHFNVELERFMSECRGAGLPPERGLRDPSIK